MCDECEHQAHQQRIAAAQTRRIQDSAVRAARLLAQHHDEIAHGTQLQTEHDMWRRTIQPADLTDHERAALNRAAYYIIDQD